MIPAIIIDDERNCILSLRADLKKHCPIVDIKEECLSGKDGILAIKKTRPQLVFLDVQMPIIDGFELLSILGEIDFCLIFTTAYDQFAAKAFRLSAVDYLLKPIDATELKDAVAKAEQRIHQREGQANVLNLLQNMRQPAAQQRIALPFKDGYEFVEVSHIIHCEAHGAYTKFFLDNKKQMLVCKTLGDNWTRKS